MEKQVTRLPYSWGWTPLLNLTVQVLLDQPFGKFWRTGLSFGYLVFVCTRQAATQTLRGRGWWTCRWRAGWGNPVHLPGWKFQWVHSAGSCRWELCTSSWPHCRVGGQTWLSLLGYLGAKSILRHTGESSVPCDASLILWEELEEDLFDSAI